MNAGIYHLGKEVLKELPNKGDIEKNISELIIYFRAKNDQAQILVFFNNIRQQLGINGVIKQRKNGQIYLEEAK